MRVYGPTPETSAETIERYGELADRGADPAVVAQGWTDAGFDDAATSRWLDARCFDAAAARALAELDITPNQSSKRTRDGKGDYIDTIGYKVANGDLTPRQAAARAISSR
ncbi:MAG: hypothetical protein QOF77_919 [Solirubrobacteraceae bacterium]|jgi:hypothetical protein|nr:hypothetical protein [Solirubrobacteraceae bacterium]